MNYPADSIDHVMELLRELRPFGNSTRQCERCSVEQSPRSPPSPIVGRAIPLKQHLVDTLKIDDLLSEHCQDCVIGVAIREHHTLVAQKLLVLCDSLITQRLDDLCY